VTNHALPNTSIVPEVESPIRIVDTLAVTLRASQIYFTNVGYSNFEISPYTCMKYTEPSINFNFNMQTLPPIVASSIHQHGL